MFVVVRLRPIEKVGSLCCGVRSKRGHSILDNGMICAPAFLQNSFTIFAPQHGDRVVTIDYCDVTSPYVYID